MDSPEEWRKCGRLVFVCSGNICRSPYAEAVARSCGAAAISCGTSTQLGLPADGIAIKEAAARAMDITAHRTTPWEQVQLAPGDVIVAMQLRHAMVVLSRARQERAPVVMLSSVLSSHAVISDPYGWPQKEYTRIFDLIDTGVRSIVQRMNNGG
jgi:protein-tyrosine phosphatase